MTNKELKILKKARKYQANRLTRDGLLKADGIDYAIRKLRESSKERNK
jgi:hypothetical protein